MEREWRNDLSSLIGPLASHLSFDIFICCYLVLGFIRDHDITMDHKSWTESSIDDVRYNDFALDTIKIFQNFLLVQQEEVEKVLPKVRTQADFVKMCYVLINDEDPEGDDDDDDDDDHEHEEENTLSGGETGSEEEEDASKKRKKDQENMGPTQESRKEKSPKKKRQKHEPCPPTSIELFLNGSLSFRLGQARSSEGLWTIEKIKALDKALEDIGLPPSALKEYFPNGIDVFETETKRHMGYLDQERLLALVDSMKFLKKTI